ncbi:hypothetical protein ACFSMW_05950 [Virgibacillus halophilus]
MKENKQLDKHINEKDQLDKSDSFTANFFVIALFAGLVIAGIVFSGVAS